MNMERVVSTCVWHVWPNLNWKIMSREVIGRAHKNSNSFRARCDSVGTCIRCYVKNQIVTRKMRYTAVVRTIWLVYFFYVGNYFSEKNLQYKSVPWEQGQASRAKRDNRMAYSPSKFDIFFKRHSDGYWIHTGRVLCTKMPNLYPWYAGRRKVMNMCRGSGWSIVIFIQKGASDNT